VLLGYAFSPNVITSSLTPRVCPSNATPTSNASVDPLTSASPVEKHEWMAEIYEEILYYLTAQAIASVLIFILTIFGNYFIFLVLFCDPYTEHGFLCVAFPEAPPTPPSKSRQLECIERREIPLVQQLKEFVYSLWLFIKNVQFMLLLVATGEL